MINGTCESKDNCVVCKDHGTERRNKEVWNRDKCTSCICEGKTSRKISFHAIT